MQPIDPFANSWEQPQSVQSDVDKKVEPWGLDEGPKSQAPREQISGTSSRPKRACVQARGREQPKR